MFSFKNLLKKCTYDAEFSLKVNDNYFHLNPDKIKKLKELSDDEYLDMILSPSHTYIAATTKREIKIFNTKNFSLLGKIKLNYNYRHKVHMCFSPNNRFFILAVGRQIKIFSLSINSEISQRAHQVGIDCCFKIIPCLALYTNGQRSQANFDDISFVEEKTQKYKVFDLSKKLEGMSCVSCFAFSHNGKLLAIGHHDGPITIWTIDYKNPSFNIIKILNVNDNKEAVRHLEFSQDDYFFAASILNYNEKEHLRIHLQIWKVSNFSLVKTFKDKNWCVSGKFIFAPNNKFFLTVNTKKDVYYINVFNLSDFSLVKTLQPYHFFDRLEYGDESILRILFIPNSKYFIILKECSIEIWDIQTFCFVRDFKRSTLMAVGFIGVCHSICDIVCSSDGKMFILYSTGYPVHGKIECWQIASNPYKFKKRELIEVLGELQNNTSIISLDLSNLEIDDEIAKCIGLLLRDNRRLQHVNLSNNRFTK